MPEFRFGISVRVERVPFTFYPKKLLYRLKHIQLMAKGLLRKLRYV